MIKKLEKLSQDLRQRAKELDDPRKLEVIEAAIDISNLYSKLVSEKRPPENIETFIADIRSRFKL